MGIWRCDQWVKILHLASELDGVKIYENNDIMIMEDRPDHILNPMFQIGPLLLLDERSTERRVRGAAKL